MQHDTPSRHASTRAAALLTLCCAAAVAAAAAPARAQARDEVVAVVNGRSITQREVDASAAPQILPVQQQLYALRKAALDNFILRALLESEARRRGVAVEEFRRQLTAGRVEVAPAQVEEVYQENATVFGTMSPDEARERIRLDLENQARMKIYREALARLREGAAVEILLEGPKAPAAAGREAPARGDGRAAVEVAVFSDFECPFCKQARVTLRRVAEEYGGAVRLAHRHLPLDTHRHAFAAARAAVCADEQGSFWQYHDALFAADRLSPEVIDGLASASTCPASRPASTPTPHAPPCSTTCGRPGASGSTPRRRSSSTAGCSAAPSALNNSRASSTAS